MIIKRLQLVLGAVFQKENKRCRGVMTLIGIQQIVLVCVLCMMCLFLFQMAIISKGLREEKRHYEVLYYYVQTGEITHESSYVAEGQCVTKRKTQKKLCIADKRIFYA